MVKLDLAKFLYLMHLTDTYFAGGVGLWKQTRNAQYACITRNYIWIDKNHYKHIAVILLTSIPRLKGKEVCGS
jgi:hypothetical protein